MLRHLYSLRGPVWAAASRGYFLEAVRQMRLLHYYLGFSNDVDETVRDYQFALRSHARALGTYMGYPFSTNLPPVEKPDAPTTPHKLVPGYRSMTWLQRTENPHLTLGADEIGTRLASMISQASSTILPARILALAFQS